MPLIIFDAYASRHFFIIDYIGYFTPYDAAIQDTHYGYFATPCCAARYVMLHMLRRDIILYG